MIASLHRNIVLYLKRTFTHPSAPLFGRISHRSKDDNTQALWGLERGEVIHAGNMSKLQLPISLELPSSTLLPAGPQVLGVAAESSSTGKVVRAAGVGR